jgi:uncharacterized protein Smg (DUF494 family)
MESTRERLKNLLTILLESMESSAGEAVLDRRVLQERIAAAGYDEADFQGILAWLDLPGLLWQGEPACVGAAEASTIGQGVRIFGDPELRILRPSAIGYLLRLHHSGQITRLQMESLIHFASTVCVSPLEEQDLEPLLDQVLYASCGRQGLCFPLDQSGCWH